MSDATPKARGLPRAVPLFSELLTRLVFSETERTVGMKREPGRGYRTKQTLPMTEANLECAPPAYVRGVLEM
jgi:hypothetical protein